MSKYRCVFRNCSTIGDLKGQMPSSCVAKGCTGNFERKPGCKTFMQDAHPPEPIMKLSASEFTHILPSKGGFPAPPTIFRGCRKYPTRAVARV